VSSVAGGDPSVIVVGGGLAGLAASCALCDAGFHVTLLERRPFLGGRASSYEHPGTGEVVDNCQHVLLGCCTNLIGFYRQIGVADKIRWSDRLTLIEPGGRRSVIQPWFLPAPFHNLPSFLRASSLSLPDKISIGRALLAMLKQLPQDTAENFLSWLRRHRQSHGAMDRFWKPVLVSALNEDLDGVSVRYAAQVFRESFLKSAAAGRIGIPSVPLTELYHPAADYIRARGGEVSLRAAADQCEPQPEQVRVCAGGRQLSAGFAVLAIPFDGLERILPDEEAAQPLRRQLARFQTSPITGIHLWLDRNITDLDHAVLLDRTIQWMFNKSKLLARRTSIPTEEGSGEADPGDPSSAAGGLRISPAGSHPSTPKSGLVGTPGSRSHDGSSYLELVVSSSKSLLERSRAEIVELAVKELSEFFPEASGARLLKSAVIKEVKATYSPRPQSDSYRPGPQSAWSNVFLAGDWTATGWPATMEGAVRSGYQAAEALCAAAGRPRKFLVPDLSARGLMRLFS